MSARVQSSPFRETEWDQRLDRMLDDLKSTVHTDDEDRRTPLGIRSSSRSSSRAGSMGRRAGSLGADGVTDGGRLTHHRKEYTSPDQAVRTVADTYQYDSGDTHPSGNFQKKVVKSTYSSYNVDGGLSSELDSLKRGPSDLEMERALTQESRNILNSSYTTKTSTNNNKVIDASQEVARELVGALSCIGSDSESEDRSRYPSQGSYQQQSSSARQQQVVSSQRVSSHSAASTAELSTPAPITPQPIPMEGYGSDQQNILRIEQQMQATKSNGQDYSTLGRLKKNINELGSLIDDMDREEMTRLNKKYLIHTTSTVKEVDVRKQQGQDSGNTCTDLVISDLSRDGRAISNGHLDEDVIVNDEKGGEVRRIVWRNRYEKTYETTDSTTPSVSIEKDAKNRRHNAGSLDVNDSTTISSLTRQHVPPQISPGGQSWAEPVPLPTPPQQVSPREPGVAYIYNYGSSGGSAVQPLPPLNYVAVAPPGSESAPSPTPSALTSGGQQPVIYHYSYHYTIQPGQPLPEGAHPPSSPPPALQIVPPPATGYSSSSTTANTLNNNSVNKSSTVINEIHQNTVNRDVRHHNHHTSTTTSTNRSTSNDRLRDREPLEPSYPAGGDGGKPLYPGGEGGKPGSSTINYSVNTTNYRTDTTSGSHHPFPTLPSEKTPRSDPQPTSYDPNDPNRGRPNDPSRNVIININKTTTQTTHSTNTRDGGGPYPPNDSQVPLTSTPYRGRSRSPDRRYPAEPRYPSDSLERVRRPQTSGLPFPETSPVKPQDGTRIPRKVDELMSDFPAKNGGPYRSGYHGHPDHEPLLSGSDTRQTRTEVNLPAPERNEINTISPTRLREEREKTKNQSGPPVYYPPGHEAFSESMHTMTLKEGGRRGKAKWRAEAASGYKESSSHSESKGGMVMVPACLPLCCGAACSIM